MAVCFHNKSKQTHCKKRGKMTKITTKTEVQKQSQVDRYFYLVGVLSEWIFPVYGFYPITRYAPNSSFDFFSFDDESRVISSQPPT